MIDSMICKAYKLNKDYVLFTTNKLSKKILDKDRIILHSTYFGESKRGLKIKIWILATPKLTARRTYNREFNELLEKGLLDEINIEDEHRWINNHLNKQVRFYLRNSRYITSRVLTEKKNIQLGSSEYTILWPPAQPQGVGGQGRPMFKRAGILKKLMELIQRL